MIMKVMLLLLGLLKRDIVVVDLVVGLISFLDWAGFLLSLAVVVAVCWRQLKLSPQFERDKYSFYS
jgi:hypothetical protein